MPIYVSSRNVTAGGFRSHLVQPSRFTDRKRGSQNREVSLQLKISILVAGRAG